MTRKAKHVKGRISKSFIGLAVKKGPNREGFLSYLANVKAKI
jgi:hypothetical protein